MNPPHRIELLEKHPHDRRRAASTIITPHGPALVDQRETALAAVMVRVVHEAEGARDA